VFRQLAAEAGFGSAAVMREHFGGDLARLMM
jgi:hypothetical protein